MQEGDVQLPLIIRSRLGPYLHTPLIVGWANLLILYHMFSAQDFSANNLWGLVVGLCLTAITPVVAYQYQVRVDHEFLWYRTFLLFQRIPLSDIERIDHDRKGVIRFDRSPYPFSWFVHAKRGSIAYGFRLSHFYMSNADEARFMQLMEPYFDSKRIGKRKGHANRVGPD